MSAEIVAIKMVVVSSAAIKSLVIEPAVIVSAVSKTAVVMIVVSSYISAVIYPVVPPSVEGYTAIPVTGKIGL
jgi:hypothetical protein